MKDDATYLGTVEDVDGTTIRVHLSESTAGGLSFVRGQSYRVGQVGAFIRFPLGFADLYGVISHVGASAAPDNDVSEIGSKWIQVQLVGEGRPGKGFDRGVSQYPTIGDAAHVVTESDLRVIYARRENLRYVQIGALAAAESIPARIDIDSMVTRHCAIVGTTGSGKSTTVAGLLASLSEHRKYPSARILVIDIHGEYGAALRKRASVFRTNPNSERDEKPLFVPYWAMILDELLPITVGDLDDSARSTLANRIADLKRTSLDEMPRKGVEAGTVTADSPIPFSIHKLWFDLHCEMHATHYESASEPQSQETWALETKDGRRNGQPIERGDPMKVVPPRFRVWKDTKGDSEKIRQSKSTLNITRPIDRLGSRLRDPRLHFLFKAGPHSPNLNGEVEQDLDNLLQSWIGGDKPIAILDLSGIAPSIQSELVGALLRIVYDALFWARNLPEGGRERPLLVVLEEAHAYLSTQSDKGASAAVRRIAREGRKYGMGIMLVSQRPSDIDSSILSQCGTIVAMRLSNAKDRNHVKAAATDNLEGLFATLPVLRTGEAVIVGEAVSIPMRTLVAPPRADEMPDSADPTVIVPGTEEMGYAGPGGWNQDRVTPNYGEVIELWRRQDAQGTKIYTETTEEKDNAT